VAVKVEVQQTAARTPETPLAVGIDIGGVGVGTEQVGVAGRRLWDAAVDEPRATREKGNALPVHPRGGPL
jgi:hypothetical protein